MDKSLAILIICCCIAFTYGRNLTCHDAEQHPNHHLLASDAECGEVSPRFLPKIWNGVRVPSGEMPWIVHLYLVTEKPSKEIPNLFIRVLSGCGGTLISRRYVLSAAHCTFTVKEVHVFIPGDEYNRDKCPFNRKHVQCEDKYYLAERIINHELYNDATHHNDISLLRLSKDVDFDGYVRPICLPLSCAFLEADSLGSAVQAAGWGRSSERYVQGHLQKVDMKLEKCNLGYNFNGVYVESIPSQICCSSLGWSGDQGACQGDSGGPVFRRFYINESHHYKAIQVGVMSLAPACTESFGGGRLEFHTRVSSFVPWILDQLEE